MRLRSDVGEDAGRCVAVRQVAVVAKRARTEAIHLVRAFALLLNQDQSFRVRDWYRAQDERFDGAQYDRCRAKTDRENADDRRAEYGRLPDRTQREAHVRVEPG